MRNSTDLRENLAVGDIVTIGDSREELCVTEVGSEEIKVRTASRADVTRAKIKRQQLDELNTLLRKRLVYVG